MNCADGSFLLQEQEERRRRLRVWPGGAGGGRWEEGGARWGREEGGGAACGGTQRPDREQGGEQTSVKLGRGQREHQRCGVAGVWVVLYGANGQTSQPLGKRGVERAEMGRPHGRVSIGNPITLTGAYWERRGGNA